PSEIQVEYKNIGKIAKIVPKLLPKGQVGPCTFYWANLVLQLSNLGSVVSLIQTAVINTVKSANRQWEKTHLPLPSSSAPFPPSEKKTGHGRKQSYPLSPSPPLH